MNWPVEICATLNFKAHSDAQLIEMAKCVDEGVAKRPRASQGGRALVGQVLAKLGRPAQVRSHPEWGYPELWHDSHRLKGHLSLSHTAGFAALCLSASPVGIDVEPLTRDASRVLPRIGTEEENARQHEYWAVGQERIAFPLVLWCAKEAMAKAIGSGVGGKWTHFMVDWTEPAASILPVRYSISGPFELNEPGLVFQVIDGHLLAIVGERSVLKERQIISIA